MKRKRQRRMSQMERFWRNPCCKDKHIHRWPANGWGGGRDRDKPRKMRYHFQRHGEFIGGVIQYAPGAPWWAYDARTHDEQPFWRRCRAKRWVEARR